MEHMFPLLLLVSCSLCAGITATWGLGAKNQPGGLSTGHLRPAQGCDIHKGDADTKHAWAKPQCNDAENGHHQSQLWKELWKPGQGGLEEKPSWEQAAEHTQRRHNRRCVKGGIHRHFRKVSGRHTVEILKNPFQHRQWLQSHHIFTAMAQGVYYFCYTVFKSNSWQPNLGASVMMNSQRVASTWDTAGDDSQDRATNVAAGQLEAGESLFVKPYAKRVL